MSITMAEHDCKTPQNITFMSLIFSRHIIPQCSHNYHHRQKSSSGILKQAQYMKY